MSSDADRPTSPLRATGWSAVAFGTRQAFQLLTLLVLARLLDPADFGLMAMAVVVTGFLGVIRDFGAGAKVIHDGASSPSGLVAQFWVALTTGLALAFLIWSSGSIVAQLFAEPRVAPLLQVLAFGFAIAGLGIVPQALLERTLRFRAIAAAEFLGGVAGLATAVVAAANGLGATSLALQAVAFTAVSVASLVAATRWIPRGEVSLSDIRQTVGFGLPLVGYAAINALIRNLDYALIGRFLGSAQLGYYSLAYRLMLVPVQFVTSVSNRVVFPVLARLADDPDERRTAYVRATLATCLVGLPVAAGLAGAAEQIVHVLFGPGWEASVPVLRLLAVVAFAQVVGATIGPVFLATGRTTRLFLWGIISGVVTVPAFVAGLPFGIVGVAAAYVVVSLGLVVPSLSVALRLIGLPVRGLLVRLGPAIVAASLVGVTAAGIAWIAGPSPSAVAVLAVQVSSGTAIYVIAISIIDRAIIGDALRVLRRTST